MSERVGGSRLRLWMSLTGHRAAVLSVLALCVFVAFILVSIWIQPSLPTEIKSTDTIETIFSTMIGVIVTGTTLVVTINQIILSQENGPLGDQRRRMSDALDTRTFVSELLGETAPTNPAALLARLVELIQRRAAELDAASEDTGDPTLREEIDGLVESINNNAELVAHQLEGAEFGTFEVLYAALNFNYSANIHSVQLLQAEFSETIDEETQAQFEELESALTMFAPVREHIKTLYFQWALIDLSRYILYAAIPALIVAGCMLTFVGAGSFPGTTAGVPNITWVVSGAFTVTALLEPMWLSTPARA